MKTLETKSGAFVAYRDFPEQGRTVVSAGCATPEIALEMLRTLLIQNGDIADTASHNDESGHAAAETWRAQCENRIVTRRAVPLLKDWNADLVNDMAVAQ